METENAALTSLLMQELFLLKREQAVAKVDAILDGKSKELCIRTRYPKEVSGFVSACLARRGELEKGAGLRCSFVRDKLAWHSLCSQTSDPNQILIADPELGFDSARSELLPPARIRGHAVIYSVADPRPDSDEVVTLNEPQQFEVCELLKKHKFPTVKADQLAQRCNGNIYILTRLLTGLNDRPAWATGDIGYNLRALSLVGGWDDSNERDRLALARIVGEPYDIWAKRIYPLTRQEEPPILLDGNIFRPVSRYESWQQLGHFLADADLMRFRDTILDVFAENLPELEVPSKERTIFKSTNQPEGYSSALRKGFAETLALLGAEGCKLGCSPTIAVRITDGIVHSLLSGSEWKRWATLSAFLPKLAEAAPNVFLDRLDEALVNLETSPIKAMFGEYDGSIFSHSYHASLLWALEILAWKPDYLSRASVILARLAAFELPSNSGNTPLETLRNIFLPWLPQTLANVDARCAAVKSVIQENPKLGWSLLVGILPENHQIGHYNQKPAWRDWFPHDWSEGATRSEQYKQVQNYAKLAVQIAIADIEKLIELISRWDHLPREIFQQILDYLKSADALALPEQTRFALWEKLTNEVTRHRAYPDSDWAMPEEELRQLEEAADAIRPSEPTIVHQRIFNSYAYDLYTSDDYEGQEKQLKEARDNAVREIASTRGFSEIIKFARLVKLPIEVGSSFGRVGTLDSDLFLLPRFLDEGEQSTINFIRGYVWERYLIESKEWFKVLPLSQWTSAQKGVFFSHLPFVSDVWRAVDEKLSDDLSEYWSRIWPNVYGAKDDIIEAAERSLANNRPEIAVDCVNALIYKNKAFPTELATDAVVQLLVNVDAIKRLNSHHMLEVIKYLQEATDVDVGKMTGIEFQCLDILDRFSGGRPVFLERRIATDPHFFHEIITACYRSEKDRDKPREQDGQEQELARRAYTLLSCWKTPPGTTAEHTLDEAAFASWMEEARQLCEKSGHWAVAKLNIGESLVYSPAGLENLLQLPVASRYLNAAENEHMRRGLTTELFNMRGAHGYSAGADERNLAKTFREHAERYDLANYTRIAASLRGLAEGYERDAEREARVNPLSH